MNHSFDRLFVSHPNLCSEEYDRAMGLFVEEPNDEEKRKVLKAEEYESGLQGYKQKRGELDTYYLKS